jgi:hypothetical protein
MKVSHLTVAVVATLTMIQVGGLAQAKEAKPCADTFNRLREIEREYKAGNKEMARKQWSRLPENACWTSEPGIQEEAARIVVRLTKREELGAALSVDDISSPSAAKVLLKDSLNGKKYNLFFGQAFPLLDRIPEKERKRLTRGLGSLLLSGSLPRKIMTGTALTCMIVTNTIAIFPYPGARQDLRKILQRCPSWSTLQDYAVLVYKEQGRMPVQELKDVLSLMGDHQSLSHSLCTCLYVISANRVEAKPILEQTFPAVVPRAFSPESIHTLKQWVQVNFGSAEAF